MDNIHAFKAVFLGDRAFSKLMFAFLLVNVPMSAYLIMLNLIKQLDQFEHGFTLMIAIDELLFITVMHIYIARFSKDAHQTANQLIRFNSRNQHRVGDFRARLKLSHQIARLHTDKRYGITYAGLAPVTMNSFYKVVFQFPCDL